MDLRIKLVAEDPPWDQLVEHSPQGTIFTSSRYLRALATPFKTYFVTNAGGEVLAGVVVMETPDGRTMLPAPFHYSPYQGILFAASVSAQTEHKRATAEYRITTFIINELLVIYSNFNLSLAPQFRDVRPFLWHNYHDPEAPRFKINHRYTAVLDLRDFKLEEYLMTIRTVRRQEYKKSQAIISETADLGLFLDIYIKTFARQNITLTTEQINLAEKLTSAALQQGFGRLSMATVDGKIACMALFLYDKHSAYYHFSANDPDLREANASTKLMIESIQTMANKGLNTLDFIGINSPNRGDFKLSFNPAPTLYHEVHLDTDKK